MQHEETLPQSYQDLYEVELELDAVGFGHGKCVTQKHREALDDPPALEVVSVVEDHQMPETRKEEEKAGREEDEEDSQKCCAGYGSVAGHPPSLGNRR